MGDKGRDKGKPQKKVLATKKRAFFETVGTVVVFRQVCWNIWQKNTALLVQKACGEFFFVSIRFRLF